MEKFELISKFKPKGDQPLAIKKMLEGLKENKRALTLLGVTGSGKTFSIACVAEQLKRPILVISHNKTLASQLYTEFKDFFPKNAVEYFVSYYDYYQPESYIPQTDTYIEKDASINDRLDRLRLSATNSLITRRDVIVVASVSCIYNLGAPEDYNELTIYVKQGDKINFEDFLHKLIAIQYERNDFELKRGIFRVKGDTIDIFPSYKEQAIRIEFFGDVIEKIYEFNPVNGKKTAALAKAGIYPAKHFIIGNDKIDKAVSTIREEMKEHLEELTSKGKVLEAQRLRQRTLYDLEMLKECGYCHGIENYSRHLSGRPAGSRPYCLLDYFPPDFLTIIDESHVTIPQLRGMYEGDKSRKETLIEYGFRLPSCLDNRPLKFNEFLGIINQTVFTSATPGQFEIEMSGNDVIEQLIRPTGLVDPEIKIKPTENQIDDLIEKIKERAQKGERTLITTLTKRMSEQLAKYLKDEGIKVSYIHSEIKTLERTKIIKELRQKKYDVLVGINLLREGLDLPEVSLVAILDADKEGFLRSTTSLIQVAGRCARHINGEVIMYADTITKSMKNAVRESSRRRELQMEYNRIHKISPKSIQKEIKKGIEIYIEQESRLKERLGLNDLEIKLHEETAQLENEMYIAAKNLQFEKAIQLRDKVIKLKQAFNEKKQQFS